MILIWTFLILAVLFDARDYKIPNQLICAGYIAGLFVNLWLYQLPGSIIFIVNALVPLLITYLLFWIGGLGAGDVKIFSVLSTLVGVKVTIRVMIISIFVAAAVILLISIYKRKLIRKKLHYSYYILAGYMLVCLGV